MNGLTAVLIIVAVAVGTIWACRELFAWYTKRNKQIELQVATNKLLAANNDFLQRQIVISKEFNDLIKELLKNK